MINWERLTIYAGAIEKGVITTISCCLQANAEQSKSVASSAAPHAVYRQLHIPKAVWALSWLCQSSLSQNPYRMITYNMVQ